MVTSIYHSGADVIMRESEIVTSIYHSGADVIPKCVHDNLPFRYTDRA